MDERRMGFFHRLLNGRQRNTTSASISSSGDLRTEARQRSLSKEIQSKDPWEQLLGTSTYMIFDTETTGFDYRKDYMFSIGGVKLSEIGEIIQTFYSLIRIPDEIEIDPMFLQYSHITREDVRMAPSVCQVLHDFFQFSGDSIWVAHHARHDVNFLNKAVRQCWKTQLDTRVLDTDRVGRLLYPTTAFVMLEDWLNNYQIPIKGRHHALEDSKMTAKLWHIFLQELIQKDIQTLGDLYEEIMLHSYT